MQRKRCNSTAHFNLVTEFKSCFYENRDIETTKAQITTTLKRYASFDSVNMGLAIGDRLRKLRNDASLSIKNLSRLSGVCCNTIINIEYNKYQPTIKTALKLTTVLGAPISALTVSTEEFSSKDPRIQMKVLRLSLGLTQIEFSDLCGIDPSTIRDWELAKREISNINRKFISELLEVMEQITPFAWPG